jgi:hypothetical protein
MMIGSVHPGTRRGTLRQMIGSRKMTPPRMLRIVPLGERHICFRPNSSTLAFVGGDRGALDADPVALDGLGGIHRHLVVGRIPVLDPEVVVLELDIEERQDEVVADEVPDDARHLVAVELDDRVVDLDFLHGYWPLDGVPSG